MSTCTIDHLVVTAPSLKAGAEYVEAALGVSLESGGEHVRLGTHNLLLLLGDNVYLEVLAVNPDTDPPSRRRWFGLNDDGVTAPPRLSTWVARTDDISQSIAGAQVDLGRVESMSRGDLTWQITIPETGCLVLDGVAPSLIQWPAGAHPTRRLRDVGCRLRQLEAFHSEPIRVRRLFERLGLVDNVTVSSLSSDLTGYLLATIDGPSGPRILGGS